MTTVTLHEAQSRLSDLVHSLPPGEEVCITENERVVARLIVERGPQRQRPGPGLCKGMITVPPEDDEHLRDFAEYLP